MPSPRAVLAVVACLAGGAIAAVEPALAARAAGSPSAAAPAASSGPFRIDQSAVGRAPLGRTAAFYKQALGGTVQRAGNDDGFDRLLFPDAHLAVLFVPGKDAGVGVLTWGSRTTTAAGVGPCSSRATLLAAYRGRLAQVAKGAEVQAWRLGRLVFAVRGGYVSAVGLLRPGVSIGPVLLAPACGAPSLG